MVGNVVVVDVVVVVVVVVVDVVVLVVVVVDVVVVVLVVVSYPQINALKLYAYLSTVPIVAVTLPERNLRLFVSVQELSGTLVPLSPFHRILTIRLSALL